MTTNLDVFDAPVRQYLELTVRNIGHSPLELSPVIDAAVTAAKQQLGDSWKTQNDTLIRKRIEGHAALYMDGVLGQSRVWRECQERIKAHNSLLLVGAGLSYDSDMPLANLLIDLLKFVGAPDWDTLRADPAKCIAFKNQFKAKYSHKVPSKSHELVILNFPQYILEIISLNWDDLLEQAAAVVGKNVNKQNEDHPVTATRCLWKFHGDVANIKEDNTIGQGGWVFPGQQGYVFDSFRQYIQQTQLNNQLFTFLIVGYGEQESAIQDQIVTLLESNPPRPTYRIGLELKNLNQPTHIVGTCEFILSKIFPLKN